MGEILQGFDFGPPIFDCFGQLCQAKNFFFRDDPPQNHCCTCPAHQSVIWAQNPSKKVKINHESNFRRGFGGWNFPNKIQKYGNFEIELERVKQQ